MLKVVGASREQTRATSYILILFTFCGLLIIIFGGSMPLQNQDGNYAATVFWENGIGYRIEFWGQGNALGEIPQAAARGYYREDIADRGWSKIEIETNREYEDSVQAYAAGLLEGSLTWQLLHWRWKNTIEAPCEEDPYECERIRNELRLWSEQLRSTSVQLSELEPFWHQTHLFFAQLDGLITGWHFALRRNRSKHMDISNEDFLWLQFVATDIPAPDTSSLVPRTPSLTSGLIKLIRNENNTDQLLVAQTTAGPYRDMLRMMKRYAFNFQMTGAEGAPPAAGSVLTFTGYPGALSSQDDLYHVRSKHVSRHNLLVMGSTVGNGGWVPKIKGLKMKKRRRNLEEKVPGSLRALAATRLARDGRTWHSYFSRGRNGASIDKQWAILDLSRLDNQLSDQTGLLRIVEQSQGLVMSSDLSHQLRENNYWASYGMLHHSDIKMSTNETEKFRIRKLAFEKCRRNCTNKDEVYHLMRLAVPASEDLVGARADLYKENPLPFGVIDTKIITGSRTSPLRWHITAGPVHTANTSATENPPAGAASPFQWSTSAYFATPHYGHPDIWSFAQWIPTWVGY